MGQACSKRGDSGLDTGKSNLDLAKEKLGGKRALESLPKARNDAVWGEIRETYALTVLELSALKNYACPGNVRGVLSGKKTSQDDTLYRVADKRIRSSFIISNFDRTMEMPAELMVDSGAEGELKLPGLKVVQLGLQPHAPNVRVTSSTNDRVEMVTFFPSMRLSATFHRDDGDGGTDEILEGFVTVRAVKSDYDAALMAHQEAEEMNKASPRSREENIPAWFTPMKPTTKIKCVKLSPVRHRPNDKPDEMATLGIAGLAKLRMHINAELQQLEIEEEAILED